MPLYDYHCEANGVMVEVHHSMSLTVKTWGDLCEAAKMELGDTPPDTPVKRLVGSGSALNAKPGEDYRRPFDHAMVGSMRGNKW